MAQAKVCYFYYEERLLRGLKVPYSFHIFIHSYNYLWNNKLIFCLFTVDEKRKYCEIFKKQEKKT